MNTYINPFEASIILEQQQRPWNMEEEDSQADISDWFNFGFTEETFITFINQQVIDHLKESFGVDNCIQIKHDFDKKVAQSSQIQNERTPWNKPKEPIWKSQQPTWNGGENMGRVGNRDPYEHNNAF